ncbi:MAG: tetratricopeptide repeat protein, partial [Rhodospirillales bacterium]|nr:tetratricopeptide repeat protein [Acetobacter sp.]
LSFNATFAPPEDMLVDHRSLAEAALAKAARVNPDLGMLHLSLAIHALQINRDPERAGVEAQLARRTLPNNAQVEMITGRVARRQDRWEEAVRCFERAASLEPRNIEFRILLNNTYRYLRRYDEQSRVASDVLALVPAAELKDMQADLAVVQIERAADLGPYREVIASAVGEEAARFKNKQGADMFLALWSRDAAASDQALSDQGWDMFNVNGVRYPKEWYKALAARIRGDQVTAVQAFTEARVKIERTMDRDSYPGKSLSVLAIIDAGLGRKEQAIEEAKRACDLTPFSTLNLETPVVRCNLAVVYAWTDQNDLALAELDKLIDRPAGENGVFQPTYGDFRLNPLWDPLRSDPRFDALTRRLAPKNQHP